MLGVVEVPEDSPHTLARLRVPVVGDTPPPPPQEEVVLLLILVPEVIGSVLVLLRRLCHYLTQAGQVLLIAK